MNGIASLDRHAVKLHRLAHRLHGAGHYRSAAALVAVSKIFTGVEIEPGAHIGPGLRIVHGTGLVVNEYAVIGSDCTLYQGVTIGVSVEFEGVLTPVECASVAPKLGNGVKVYAGAKVLGNITVGDGAVIGANAVVLSDVPAGHVAVGIPARVLASKALATPDPPAPVTPVRAADPEPVSSVDIVAPQPVSEAG